MDRGDAAEPIYDSLSTVAVENENLFHSTIATGMQRALELQRVEFVQRLVDLAGAQLAFERIDMVKLYQLSVHNSSFLSEGKLEAAIGHALALDKMGAIGGLNAPATAKPGMRIQVALPVSSKERSC